MMALPQLLAFSIVTETTRVHATALADMLAGALLSTVWQGAVLVAAVALALRLVPGISAALRTRLWLAVLGVLVVLPALVLLLPHGVAVTARHSLQVSSTWSVWLVCAWALLSSARAIKLAAGALRLRRIARLAVPVNPAESAELLQHGSRAVELCVSAEVGRPSVVGFLRPRILLPPALFAALAPDELRQVLLHEMEHLRRHDDWTNLAQKLALVVLPLDPALFWVEWRLCVERELACDDGVLRETAARKAYAACLVSLAEHAMLQRGAALALGAWEKQTELARRVHRILRRPEPALRPRVARLVAGGLVGGVLAGGSLLAGSPQLVSFAPPEVGLAMASAHGVTEDHMLTAQGDTLRAQAMMQPVVARVSGGGAHGTLASAVLPTRVGAAASAFRAHGVRAHARALQQASIRAGAPVRESRTFRQVSNRVSHAGDRVSEAGYRVARVGYRVAQDDPRPVLLTAWPNAAPVLTLSVDAADDQFSLSYAAVPVRGGWLLVQL